MDEMVVDIDPRIEYMYGSKSGDLNGSLRVSVTHNGRIYTKELRWSVMQTEAMVLTLLTSFIQSIEG